MARFGSSAPTRRRAPAAAVALALTLALAVVVLGYAAVTRPLTQGQTLLLPGAPGADGIFAVTGPEVSVALDVRNTGLLPVRVLGVAPVLGAAPSVGQGPPGGGFPEERAFAPFTLGPGQVRLLVVRAVVPTAGLLTTVTLRTSVLGLPHDDTLALTDPLRVTRPR